MKRLVRWVCVRQAALHSRFGGPEAGNLRTEAVEVAAVALAIVECLDREKWDWPYVPATG